MRPASRFINEHSLVIAVLSLLVVTPCFWHRRIEAGDLPSHIYNAWLASLIEQGQAPGLYLASRWNNVLFDLLLLWFSKSFGFHAGTKIVVSLCVLIFFWGVFSLIAAATQRPPWLLTPCVAMLAYGYAFNMGFFNYYLSIGLACFGLALLWDAQPRDWLASTLIFLLAVLAHPIGSLWFLVALAYICLRRKFDGPSGLLLPSMAIAGLAAVHWYLAHFAKFQIDWPERPFYFFNGADQLVVYSQRYRWFAIFAFGILIVWLVLECFRWKDYLSRWKPLALVMELYILTFCATALLPQGLRISYFTWIGLLVSRLTLVSAICALCVAGFFKPRHGALVALLVCAAAFFLTLYKDTALINLIEIRAEEITTRLPYGTRVITTLRAAPDSRISFIRHVVDRACIGHCFVYSNYEAASGQFRIRVRPGSLLITSQPWDSPKMEEESYVVRASDPPLKAIYQCPGDLTALCIRDLVPGDTTSPPQTHRR